MKEHLLKAHLLPDVKFHLVGPFSRVFPSDGLRRYSLSILTTSGGSEAQMPLK